MKQMVATGTHLCSKSLGMRVGHKEGNWRSEVLLKKSSGKIYKFVTKTQTCSLPFHSFPNFLLILSSPMAVPTQISLSAADPFASNNSKPLPLSSSRTLISGKIEQTNLGLLTAFRRNQGFALKASMGSPGFTQQVNNSKVETLAEVKEGCDVFNDLKDRFFNFKKNIYMKNTQQFENLAKAQEPKFMVIACADSRVCPSNVLGFQPGEAFTIRNVANLVPPFERPSETNAALEFAVNTLLVENILVIGHSCCGGIRALMGMEDDAGPSFIKSWVVLGKNAKVKTKAAASNLDFDEQCKHCEKESINHSLLNLLSYPWIEEKVANGKLLIHGGYYDFIDCSFEKWTLDYRATQQEENGRIATQNKVFWC